MSASTALVAYAESFLDGRRTVVFGEADGDLPDALVDRGARVVHVFDPDPARAGIASARSRAQNVSFAPLADADVAVRDGAFDVAFVPDLAAFDDASRIVKRVMRALSPRGIAFFAAPNPEIRHRAFEGLAHDRPTIGYYDLYDTVSEHFDEVRMLGQTPFVGFAVVDFAHEGDTEISFDSGFVPGGAEEPEWYIAAGSQRAAELEAFMVVQLPAARTLRNLANRPPVPAIGSERVEVNSEHDARIAELQKEAARAERAAEEAAARAEQAAAGIKERDARIGELRQEAARAERAAAEIGERDDRIRALERKIAEDESRLAEQDAQIRKLEAAATPAVVSETASPPDDTAERLKEAETELGTARERVVALEGELRSIKEAERRAETERRNQARRLEELDATLARETSRASELETKCRELEERAARAEAQKESNAARVAELEAALAAEREASTPKHDDPDDYDHLEAALSERAQEVRRLQDLLRETERTGQDLVREVETLRRQGATSSGDGILARQPAPEGEPTVDTRAARCEADLQAARWTIDELEGLLESENGPDVASLSRQLAEARAELQRRQTLLSQLRKDGEIRDPAR